MPVKRKIQTDNKPVKASKKAKNDPAPVADELFKDDANGKVSSRVSSPVLSFPHLKNGIIDEQKAASRDLVIAPDEHSGFTAAEYKVYIDETGTIHDAMLNQHNGEKNNNKFYVVQLLVSVRHSTEFTTFTRWGRVGEPGQSAQLGDGSLKTALSAFEKKFKDKTGLKWVDREDAPRSGKYVFLQRSYDSEDATAVAEKAPDSEPEAKKSYPPSELPPAVQKLMEFILDESVLNEAMSSMNYDANRQPLGSLSKRTLSEGYKALKALSEILSDESNVVQNMQRIRELSNLYFTYIPHVIRRGTNQRPISTMHDVKREADLLQSLGYMIEANEIKDIVVDYSKNPIDTKFDRLGMKEMLPLESKSKEYQEIEKYLQGTSRSVHSMKLDVQEVFRIQRNGEFERFDQSSFGKTKKSSQNRKLLWHGSRATNFAGILSQGLRIAPPEAPVNGYMFGKGIYLADMSTKSANYCCHYSTKGVGLILLCEAELGPQLELTTHDYSAATHSMEKGCWSTKGRGSATPDSWKDAGCIHPSLKGVAMPDVSKGIATDPDAHGLLHNEYICYDVDQVRLRYLIRFKDSSR